MYNIVFSFSASQNKCLMKNDVCSFGITAFEYKFHSTKTLSAEAKNISGSMFFSLMKIMNETSTNAPSTITTSERAHKPNAMSKAESGRKPSMRFSCQTTK